MITCEDIEKQVQNSMMIRLAMNKAVDQLKKAEKNVGPDVLKIIILGKRPLTPEEYKEASKRFGVNGLNAIEMMEHLNTAQKQYLFKRMGYDEKEIL